MSDRNRASPTVQRLWRMMVDADVDVAATELDDETFDPALAGNGLRQIVAMTLQKMGDVVVDAKAVLSWLLIALGAPAAALALLVPIREAGSLLPQTLLLPRIHRVQQRKRVWVAGATGQALAVGGMAFVAGRGPSPAAGWTILALLALFAVARAASSIASKDVMGRTIPPGLRGRVTGAATTAAGLVALTLGLALGRTDFDAADGTRLIAWLLVAAACSWFAAGAVFAGVKETPRAGGTDHATRGSPGSRAEGSHQHDTAWRVLRDDAVFRRFVAARSLLLVSALSPPFLVAIAVERGADTLATLGAFVIAGGLAAFVGGRLWGRFADRSSRATMAWAALLAALLLLAMLGALRIPAMATMTWLFPIAHFLLVLIHTGARIGRKTYLVDFAEGDRRTVRVAVSNTALGFVLLAVGGLTSLLAMFGNQFALAALAVFGLVGFGVARSLPEARQSAS